LFIVIVDFYLQYHIFINSVNGFRYFLDNFGQMAHNVPAVYDVLPARIRACVARPGLAKCAGTMAWEWSEAK
jgi:hypothetical protein